MTDNFMVQFLGRSEYPDRVIASFGENWPRLCEIKKKYDPSKRFVVAKGVGWVRALLLPSETVPDPAVRTNRSKATTPASLRCCPTIEAKQTDNLIQTDALFRFRPS